MRALSINELAMVSGGDTAPVCTTQAVTVTGSNGVSATFYVTVCQCPTGSGMQVTTTSTGAAVTCKE
jgi:hypothetical protein